MITFFQMKNSRKVIVIVLDSVGVGAMPDAEQYGDTGANTLRTLLETRKNLKIPNLRKMGFLNIPGFEKYGKEKHPTASFGKMAELSHGKDTMTGHWEMMGLITEKAFPRFPDGFPKDLTDEFMNRTGMKGFLGNSVASGTVIIKDLGEEHIRTGFPIIYTSADSVFQIAAHNDVIPLKKLYKICEISRDICNKYNIGRVIARPFIGNSGNFTRTSDRKDYPMTPPSETVLDRLKSRGFNVIGIGKIEDIFAGRGLTEAFHTVNNSDGMKILTEEIEKENSGFIFVNLVDFDMLYGHRRDPEGYCNSLEEFDINLELLLNKLKPEDILMITADHGCDPGFKGTEHTREYVPILIYNKVLKSEFLGIRSTFSDIGITVLDLFDIEREDFQGEKMIKKQEVKNGRI